MKNFIYAFLVLITGVLTVLAQPANVTFYPEVEWLPNGKYLSFTMISGSSPKDFQADIYTIKTDGSELKKLTSEEKNEFGSSWSKDGKSFMFSAGVRGNFGDSDIYLAKRDGSGVVQISKTTGGYSTPSSSPDGKKILFTSSRDSKNPRKPQIYVMSSDGSNITRLTTDSELAYYDPHWSPDGKKIVYYAEKGDNKDQIWTMNVDGTNQTLLTNNIGHNYYPSWLPNGKKIVFTSKRDGNEASAFYTIDADGKNLTQIPYVKGMMIKFSPDGKKIAFVAPKSTNQPGKPPESSIFIANADGTGVIKIVGN
ncbi:MAG TPA: DPP IV N-terminal domain-containing protein [Pyrinomonadaceae bacterium]|nr:DPP IV N-terminal domain-containing protein [Pyrinomonadaceae bacterium]